MSRHDSPWWWPGHLPKDCPPLLYHYTHASSIYEIVKSQHLRATQVEYSNDRMEYRLAIKIAVEVLKERLRSEQTELLSEFYKGALAALKKDWEYPKFIVSFSARKNVLSQWRAYGGYCIAFNRDELYDVAQFQTFSLFKCLYKGKEHREQIDDLLKLLIRQLGDGKELEKRAEDFGMYLTMMATAFKHSSFHQEAEWRLVGFDNDHKHVDFRYDEYKLIPFRCLHLDHNSIPMFIDRISKLSKSLCIHHFALGPNVDQPLAKQSLMRFVKHHNEQNERNWNDVIDFDIPLKPK